VPRADLRAPGAWERFWFAEGSLVRLGAFRIVLSLTALYAVFQHRDALLAQLARGTPEYVRREWNPIFAFQVLGVGPPDETTATVLYVATLGSILLAAAGLFARASCALAAVLAFLEIGTAYSLGKPHHDCIALVFGLFSLPFAPVGARLSIDAWIRRRAGGKPPAVAPFAGLPLRFTQVSAAIGYAFAGASKLAIGGLTWLNGYSLQGILLHFHGDWTAFFAGHVGACRAMSIGLVFVQATFPVAVFVPLLRWFYVPAAVSFHLLTWKTMDTGPYLTLWLTLASFVPLEEVPGFIRARATRGPIAGRIAWTTAIGGSAVLVASLYLAIFPPWVKLAAGAAAAGVVLARVAQRRSSA
jgi:hypothetical protein